MELGIHPLREGNPRDDLPQGSPPRVARHLAASKQHDGASLRDGLNGTYETEIVFAALILGVNFSVFFSAVDEDAYAAVRDLSASSARFCSSSSATSQSSWLGCQSSASICSWYASRPFQTPIFRPSHTIILWDAVPNGAQHNHGRHVLQHVILLPPRRAGSIGGRRGLDRHRDVRAARNLLCHVYFPRPR